MPPVRISGAGLVIDRVVKVRGDRKEDVLWIAQDGGGPWRITFDKASSAPSTHPVEPDSPFTKREYIVQKGGSEGTTGGPVKGIAGRTYRYTVRDHNTGQPTDDPDVDVE